MVREHVDIARELYVAINEDGTKRLTLREIAMELQKRTQKKYNPATIHRWAKKYSWDSQLNKLRLKRVQKIEKSITFESDEINKELYDIYKMSRLMVIRTANVISDRLTDDQEENGISLRELIAANRAFADSMGRSIELALGKSLNIESKGVIRMDVTPDESEF